MEVKKETEALYARLDDLVRRAQRGEAALSPFLSPRELYFAEAWLNRQNMPFFAYGGYESSERCRICVLPDYVDGEISLELLSEYGISLDICSLRVAGSGFCKLSHRDFLGSLLGLGLDRSVLGDICVFNDGEEAVVFCDSGIARFLLEEWKKAGNDKIRVTEAALPRDFSPEKRFLQISDTVASPRLDGVVAALCSLSREKAREAVTSELVELDYETEARPDRTVCAPCLISVRGYGKFRVLSVSDLTKKGRYRLVAQKYI